MKVSALTLFALLMFCSMSAVAEELSYEQGYDLACKWIKQAQADFEGHQVKVVSNEWSSNGKMVVSVDEKDKKSTIEIDYRTSNETYRWLRPGDLVKFKVRDDMDNKISLRDEIIKSNNKLGTYTYYNYLYITGVVLAPASK